MVKRVSILLCIGLLGLALAGCSKCDVPTWGGPQSCRGAAPVN